VAWWVWLIIGLVAFVGLVAIAAVLVGAEADRVSSRLGFGMAMARAEREREEARRGA
jgi:hypothetical protein